MNFCQDTQDILAHSNFMIETLGVVVVFYLLYCCYSVLNVYQQQTSLLSFVNMLICQYAYQSARNRYRHSAASYIRCTFGGTAFSMTRSLKSFYFGIHSLCSLPVLSGSVRPAPPEPEQAASRALCGVYANQRLVRAVVVDCSYSRT